MSKNDWLSSMAWLSGVNLLIMLSSTANECLIANFALNFMIFGLKTTIFGWK